MKRRSSQLKLKKSFRTPSVLRYFVNHNILKKYQKLHIFEMELLCSSQMKLWNIKDIHWTNMQCFFHRETVAKRAVTYWAGVSQKQQLSLLSIELKFIETILIKCGNLKVVIDGGVLTRNINQKKTSGVSQA